jgi:hypothetical protein
MLPLKFGGEVVVNLSPDFYAGSKLFVNLPRLGTLTNTSSAGTGSNPTIGIQSSIVAVNFYRTLSV